MKIPERYTSRKFLGLILATGLTAFGKLTDWVWFWVFLVYVGGNVLTKAIELAKLWLKKGNTDV